MNQHMCKSFLQAIGFRQSGVVRAFAAPFGERREPRGKRSKDKDRGPIAAKGKRRFPAGNVQLL